MVITHEEANMSDPLLSSFNETDDLNEGGEANGILQDKHENSDDRLINDNDEGEQDQELANIQETVFASSSSNDNQNNSEVDSNSNGDRSRTATLSSPYPETTTSSIASQQFNLNYLRNNFNFLDRVFKTHHNYQKIASTSSQSGPNDNDGVFNNLSAKPDTQPVVDSDKPPTYEEAAADATPPYWETSVLAAGFTDEVFVDGLPVGNIVNFMWNLMVSASFQFVGFLLTYILHTSHAAKQGSRAGLGITFISYGYYMIPYSSSSLTTTGEANKLEPQNPNDYETVNSEYEVTGSVDHFHSSLSSGVEKTSDIETTPHASFIAYLVIGFGVFIFIKAMINYHRAKQMEKVILQPPSNMPAVEEV